MPPLPTLTPRPFPVTTECATRRMAPTANNPVALELATTLRSITAVGAWPDAGVASAPRLMLLEAKLSTMVILSDVPVVPAPFTMIPLKLLFVVTLLSRPVTTAEPVGPIWTPTAELLEAIVFDTEKLLDVLG